MKRKILLLCAVFVLTLGAAFAQNAAALDGAVETSANQIIAQILLRTADFDMDKPVTNVKVAILDFDTPSADLSEYIVSDLTKYFLRNIRFAVVERQFLDRARRELDFNMTGEVSDGSAQSLGNFVGAQVVVFGWVKRQGNIWRLQIRAITVEGGVILGQETASVRSGDIDRFVSRAVRPAPAPRPARTPAPRPARTWAPAAEYSFSPVIAIDFALLTNGGSYGLEFGTLGLEAGINIQSSKNLL